jgi:hypothetical protein
MSDTATQTTHRQASVAWSEETSELCGMLGELLWRGYMLQIEPEDARGMRVLARHKSGLSVTCVDGVSVHRAVSSLCDQLTRGDERDMPPEHRPAVTFHSRWHPPLGQPVDWHDRGRCDPVEAAMAEARAVAGHYGGTAEIRIEVSTDPDARGPWIYEVCVQDRVVLDCQLISGTVLDWPAMRDPKPRTTNDEPRTTNVQQRTTNN